jgi:uncharacterized protein with ParB-like and HNH nuclease domain
MTEFKFLKEYLYPKDKIFRIPNYQRGYKWAVKENGNESAVEELLNNLISAYKDERTKSYFLQGITVNEDGNNIILIDGQQRTTTLYLLLWCIGKEHIKDITINYEIREKSHNFLSDLKKDDFSISEKKDDNQDIHYFKEAIEKIKQKMTNIDNKDFLEFLLEKVEILYINIPKDKATKIFTMMNGSKATMLPEELIKAEMLRIISLKNTSNSDDDNSKEWEINMLRSRYAREWDKWLYWWNKKDVQDFFKVYSPMGLLLEYYYKKQMKDSKSKLDFNNFKKLFLDSSKKTKKCFKEIRDLQKSFEDIFNNPIIFNYLGLALKGKGKEKEPEKSKVINYFIEEIKNIEKIKEYAKWSLVDATHLEIINPEKKSDKINKADAALQALSGNVYKIDEAYEFAAKQLLRLNVEEDIVLDRKFDFSIYDEKRSLEHIHPQSKITNLSQNDEWLVHSIGNILLLHKDDNSKLSNSSFEEKKNIYFNLDKKFHSRNLLHTISVFANSKWDKEEIERNRKEFIERFEKDYFGDDYDK